MILNICFGILCTVKMVKMATAESSETASKSTPKKCFAYPGLNAEITPNKLVYKKVSGMQYCDWFNSF